MIEHCVLLEPRLIVKASALRVAVLVDVRKDNCHCPNTGPTRTKKVMRAEKNLLGECMIDLILFASEGG